MTIPPPLSAADALTPLDQMALAALPGLLMRHNFIQMGNMRKSTPEYQSYSHITEVAYDIADTLMAEKKHRAEVEARKAKKKP